MFRPEFANRLASLTSRYCSDTPQHRIPASALPNLGLDTTTLASRQSRIQPIERDAWIAS
jgi:hypothetical protein